MLLKIGIKRELSCAHTPLQNGVSERKNRHLVESCRAGPCYRPREFRRFLRANALGLQPFCITKLRLRKFPTRRYMICYTRRYQMLGTHLRLFGCVCYVHLPEPSKGKLDKKAVKCVFVGSSTERKGWRYMEPSTRRVYESRSTEGLSVAGMSNLSMTSDSVLRCTSMCTRAAEYSFHKG